MWNLKNKANEHILYNKQKQTHSTENKLVVSGWEREQGMEKTGVQHSHYFIVNLNGIKSIKIFNHYTVHLKYCKSIILWLKKNSINRLSPKRG